MRIIIHSTQYKKIKTNVNITAIAIISNAMFKMALSVRGVVDWASLSVNINDNILFDCGEKLT